MTPQQATRLVRVADALRDAFTFEWYFSMSTYGSRWDEAAELGSDHEQQFVDEHKCGTPACALGHYAVRDDLQLEFGLDREGELVNSDGDIMGHNDDAVYRHFGVTHTEADALFDSGGCGGANTAEEAAVFIEEFVINKGFDIT